MSQIRLAVEGNTKSGVVVAQIRSSTSPGAVAVLASSPRTASRAHMRGAEPLALEDVPFLDAGALDDPLVAGVDHLRQFGIGEHVGRHIAENPGDRGADRGLPDRFFRLAHADALRLRCVTGGMPAALAGCSRAMVGPAAGRRLTRPRRRMLTAAAIAAAAPGDIEDDGGGLGARRSPADRHDGVEPREGLDLAPPLRRVGQQRNKRVGQLLRRAIPLQQFRNDVLADDEIGEDDTLQSRCDPDQPRDDLLDQ